MFNKLLTNLPFNPGLIDQVSFYAKRLHQETSIRRLSSLMVALGMFIQLFAVLAPAQPTLALSNNDVIRGGIQSKQQAVDICNRNDAGFRQIVEYFGVTCDRIASGNVESVRSTDYNRQLYSMGRLPYGKQGEVSVNIPNTGTFYMRPLWSWDTGAYSTYTVIKGTRSNGTPFMIMYDCGNIVIVGTPTPPPPPPPPPPTHPKIDITKDVSKQVVTVNEVFDYTIVAKNTGDVTLTNAVVTDNAPSGVEFVPTAPSTTKAQFRTVIPSLAKGARKSFTIKAKITREVPGRVTNTACVDAPSVPGNPDDCDNADNVVEACPYNPSLPKDSPSCKPCEKSQNQTDQTACLVLSKKASNDTQSIAEADGTMAKAGDVITYTLSVKNTGKATVKGFVVQENISDIMDYAEVTDLHGGTKDAQNMVTYPGADIKPGETLNKQITVKIKSPIPQTPVSSSDPGSHDLTMTNVYGNVVNVKLPPSIIKTTEQITKDLPNTGPGTSLMMAIALTVFVSYFFYRSRLLATEVDILRVDYASS